MRQHQERMMPKTIAELLVGALEQVGVMKRTGTKDRTSTGTTMSVRMGRWFMDHLDCAAVAIGRHRRCHLFRLDTRKRH
jgi:hypothetical protein